MTATVASVVLLLTVCSTVMGTERDTRALFVKILRELGLYEEPYDSPEPRRMIHPGWMSPLPKHGLFYGKPNCHGASPSPDKDLPNTPIYETQIGYLKRLDLLADAEREQYDELAEKQEQEVYNTKYGQP